MSKNGTTVMKGSLEVRYGALMSSLKEQLWNQGFEVPIGLIAPLEADRQAIQRLYLRDLLTTAQKDGALKKLHKEVLALVEALRGAV